jgi:hypothetical protein
MTAHNKHTPPHDERQLLTNTRPNTHARPDAHGKNNGARPILPQITYVACEYTTTTTTTNPNTGMPNTTVLRCTTPAQLMPGYQRACTAHTFHVLLATLNQYLLSRESIPTPQRTPQYHQDVQNITQQRDTLTQLLAGATLTMPKNKRAHKE